MRQRTNASGAGAGGRLTRWRGPRSHPIRRCSRGRKHDLGAAGASRRKGGAVVNGGEGWAGEGTHYARSRTMQDGPCTCAATLSTARPEGAHTYTRGPCGPAVCRNATHNVDVSAVVAVARLSSSARHRLDSLPGAAAPPPSQRTSSGPSSVLRRDRLAAAAPPPLPDRSPVPREPAEAEPEPRLPLPRPRNAGAHARSTRQSTGRRTLGEEQTRCGWRQRRTAG